MSDPEGNSQFCFPESPDVSQEECFVIFLDFDFNSNKKNNRSEPKRSDLVPITTQSLFFKPLNE